MNWYKQIKISANLNYKELIELQRSVEGMRAAMKDPLTGQIYVGLSHQSIVDRIKDPEVAKRLSEILWFKNDDAGFLDKNGKFITRDEAEKQYSILTVEDLNDLRQGKNLARLFHNR